MEDLYDAKGMKHIKKNQIMFNYPPFVDGTYEQVVALIRDVFSRNKITHKEYEQLFINDVYKLKDKEDNPIKYIKKWARARASNTKGEILFTVPFLNAIPDNAQLSEEEITNLLDRVEEVFKEYGYAYEKCPFPLSKEKVLEGKKSIINRCYYEEAKENYLYGVITQDVFHDKRRR